MKNIKEFLNESILLETTIDDDTMKECIDFIVANYKSNYYKDINPEKIKFAKKLDSNGKLIAKCSGVRTLCLTEEATSITNGKFVWDDIKGDFSCKNNQHITSLEGSPKIVNGIFEITNCGGIKNLIGGPIKAEDYRCDMCDNLESLEGAPQHTVYIFTCSNCPKLKDLIGFRHVAIAPTSISCCNCINLTSVRGCPKELVALDCFGCPKLKSFAGGPKVIRKDIRCKDTGLTEHEISLWCDVKGQIIMN